MKAMSQLTEYTLLQTTEAADMAEDHAALKIKIDQIEDNYARYAMFLHALLRPLGSGPVIS